jgi:hypothetical protein
MFLFRRWPVDRSHRRVLRGLRRIYSRENNREARGLRLLRSSLTPQQRAQFDAKRSFAAIVESDIVFTTAPCLTCMRSTPMVAPRFAGVLRPLAIWSQATSCSLKRLPWRRMSPARWRWRIGSYPKSCLQNGRAGDDNGAPEARRLQK